MAELVNEHIGNQLQVSTGAPGNEGSPLLPDRDPLCLGIGPTAIPGTVFVSGAVPKQRGSLAGNRGLPSFPAAPVETCN